MSDEKKTSFSQTLSKFGLYWRQFLSRIEFKLAVKTGIAAALSFTLIYALDVVIKDRNGIISGTWTVMASIVVMQARIGGTYKLAWIRFLGVLVGSFLGGLATSLFGSAPLALAVSIAATVMICALFNLKESIRIACLSVAVVMLLWGMNTNVNPWQFAFYRLIDSCVGIIVAMSVAHALWPSQAIDRLRFHLGQQLSSLQTMMSFILSMQEQKVNISEKLSRLVKDLRQLFEKNGVFLDEAKMELFASPEIFNAWIAAAGYIQHIFELMLILRKVEKENPRRICDSFLEGRLNETIQQMTLALHSLEGLLELKTEQDDLKPLLFSRQSLQDDLMRFRHTQTTRQFSFKEIEPFYVFFYTINAIIDDLVKISDVTLSLNQNGRHLSADKTKLDKA